MQSSYSTLHWNGSISIGRMKPRDSSSIAQIYAFKLLIGSGLDLDKHVKASLLGRNTDLARRRWPQTHQSCIKLDRVNLLDSKSSKPLSTQRTVEIGRSAKSSGSRKILETSSCSWKVATLQQLSLLLSQNFKIKKLLQFKERAWYSSLWPSFY